jgi:hypothetical protein
VFEDKFLELFRLKRKKNSTIHFSSDIIFVIKSGIDDKWNMQHTETEFSLSPKERGMA